MKTKYLRSFLLKLSMILVGSLFFGCAPSVNNTLQKIGITHKVQTAKILSSDEVAGDIKLSISALIMEMRHKHLKSNLVSFDPKGAHLIYEDNFRYKNFRWDFLRISKYKLLSKNGNSSTFRLEGLISFSDSIGRTTSSLFSMDYKVINRNRIVILDSEIFQHYLASKNVQAYFVPLYKLQRYLKSKKSFLQLYRFAKKNAIRVRANNREYRAYRRLSFIDKVKGRLPDKSIKGKFVAIVFAMERFPKEYNFTIKIGDRQGQIYTDSKAPILYKNFNGWRVGIVGFNGEIRAHKNIFTINVFVQKSKYSNEEQIAQFNNAMDYSRKRLKNGPLARGEVLLNPKVKSNAKVIQARLYYLGYYHGKIDGDFGKNSKKALGYFIADHLKSHYNKWTLNVQKRLFRNTGF